MTQGFEFVDHPADIQVHSWGTKFEGALESQAIALFETMFDTSKFKDDIQKTISIQANDLYALVFQFLDEWLFIFDTEDFVLKSVKITNVIWKISK